MVYLHTVYYITILYNLYAGKTYSQRVLYYNPKMTLDSLTIIYTAEWADAHLLNSLIFFILEQ